MDGKIRMAVGKGFEYSSFLFMGLGAVLAACEGIVALDEVIGEIKRRRKNPNSILAGSTRRINPLKRRDE